jgi:RNA polymerase sigma-70 factor (ECF subfamily)
MVAVTTDFESMFRSQYPRLVALGVAMTGRRDIAHELAQETMMRAHRRWDEVSEYEAPHAWLRRVMTNLLIDHHRSTKAERAAVDRLASVSATTTPPPALDDWWDLVGPLPARQRAIVTLYYADDQSVGEIAETLTVSKGTVKASLFKARRSIERRLRDQERHDG